MEATPAAPIPESPSAWQSVEESAATANGLGGGERLASTADGLATVPGATAEAAGSSGAEAGVTDVVPRAGAEKPVVPEEQMVLPEASKGMVEPTVRPRSPPSGASSCGGGGRGGRDRT